MEIAYAEKPGRDAALQVEERLRNEHETGLTEDERYNVEVMDTLMEKYPNAFKIFTDTNGDTAIQTGLWGIENVSVYSGAIRQYSPETIKSMASISDERVNFLVANILDLKNEVNKSKSELLQNLLFHGGAVLFSKYGADLVQYFEIDKEKVVLKDRRFTGMVKTPLQRPLEGLSVSNRELFKKIMAFINTHNELLAKENENKKKQGNGLDWLK